MKNETEQQMLLTEQIEQLETKFENFKGKSKKVSNLKKSFVVASDDEETDFGLLKMPMTNRSILKDANPDLLKLQGKNLLHYFSRQKLNFFI